MREKNHYDNHSEVIPTNIKNVSVIANKVHVIKVIPNICKTFPISFRYLCVPITQRFFSICMVFDIVPYSRIR